MSSRKIFVDTAKKYLGCRESDGTHKQIIDTYNSRKPLPRGYKVKYSDEWCATFVSAISIECGYTSIIPTECGCQEQINLFKQIGSWQENENYTPKTGDIIYYDWQDNGAGDNKGHSDHVGIVESVSDGVITVIEGNKNEAVARLKIAVNGRYIRGFGVPKYTEETYKPVTFEIKLPDLSNYKGNSIVDALKSIGYDSSFRSRTELYHMVGFTDEYKGTATQNISLLKKLSINNELPSLKGYKGFSIVDGLKSFGYKSSFAYRKQLWAMAGKTTTYKGTAKQNLELLGILKGV